MPSQPLPLLKLSSSIFVPVHREGVSCWLLDSIKNELVSSGFGIVWHAQPLHENSGGSGDPNIQKWC